MLRVHPGRLLAREMAIRGLSASALALALRVPANRMSEIIAGRRSISPETALRLARYLGTDAELWTRLQADYDLQEARSRLQGEIEREVEPSAA